MTLLQGYQFVLSSEVTINIILLKGKLILGGKKCSPPKENFEIYFCKSHL